MKKTNDQPKTLDHYGNCPVCGKSWDGGEIFDTMRSYDAYDNLSDHELYAMIRKCYPPPYKWSRLLAMEDPEKYDGVWEYHCPDCGAVFDSEIKKLRS